jgi:hypothetical protein
MHGESSMERMRGYFVCDWREESKKWGEEKRKPS